MAKRLCIYSASALTQMGGIETHIDVVSKAFSQKFEISIVAGKGKQIFERKNAIKYFSFPYLKRQNFFNKFLSKISPSIFSPYQIECISFWPASFLHFFSHDYEVIQVHQPIDALFFNFLKNFKKFKLVLTINGFPTSILKNEMKKCDKVIAISETVKEFMKQNYAIDSVVIFDPVDCAKFKPLPKNNELLKKFNLENSFTILCIGRLVSWKGFQFVIKALPKILKSIPNARLLIVGKGEFESELKKIVSELKIEKNIVFAGQVSHEMLPQYYSVCDIFIQPSIAMESLSLTLVSGQASGKACIASDLGAMKEIIVNGKNGFLVLPENENAIAEKVVEIFSSPSLKKQFEENARKNALQRFDLSKNIAKFEELFSLL
ncbi:MAG: glycosyltransferase family 4 protein [archaeon]|nr:glycosyltransferase family 4 protein [archaeon]